MISVTMKKMNIVGLTIALFFAPPAINSLAQSYDDENVIRLLTTAKGFFRSIENRDYAVIWDTITVKSRAQIIKNVHKAQKGTGERSSMVQIRTDFANCAVTCRSFWDAYFNAFDPKLALEESRWEIGFVKKRKAEILITHRDSERPAQLKMYREKGVWKVGLMETFWTYGTRRSMR